MRKLLIVAILAIVASVMCATAYAAVSTPSAPAEFCTGDACGYADSNDCPNLQSCPVRQANGTLGSEPKTKAGITVYGSLRSGGCGRGACRVPE